VQVTKPNGKNAGDDNNNGLLDPGEIFKYTCDTVAPQTCFGNNPITNTATSTTKVVGSPGKPVEDEEATLDVACLEPSTNLTKTSNKTFVNPGESIIYTYLEENTGNVPLLTPTVTDDKCNPVEQVTKLGKNVGDDNNNGLLDPGEVFKYTWIDKCLV